MDLFICENFILFIIYYFNISSFFIMLKINVKTLLKRSKRTIKICELRSEIKFIEFLSLAKYLHSTISFPQVYREFFLLGK